MIAYQLKEMQNNLDKMYLNNMFFGRKIIVFGSNEPAECITHYLEKKQIQVSAYVDNNKKKQGTQIKSIPVFAPEECLCPFQSECLILIASKYYEEMRRQLAGMGYVENKQVFQLVHMNQNSSFSLADDVFMERKSYIQQGLELLAGITEKWGQHKIFICPYPALGDVYLAGGYIKAYCKKHKIQSFVMVVTSKACGKVLKLFEIENICVKTVKETECLVQTCIFLGLEKCNVKILHQRFPYTSRIGACGNYKGIDFNTLFASGIFGLKKTDFQKPQKKSDVEMVKQLFEQYHLKKGKTVVLAPYANTVAALPEKFWSDIVKKYQSMDYTIVTNSSGEQEPAVSGTKALFVPIELIITFVEYAGTFIGLRSGLCDLIESAEAKKVIYYPRRVYQCGAMIDFYGLKAMGFDGNLEEIELEV